MSEFEFGLLLFTIVGVFAGGWGIFWARMSPDAGRRLWGRRLFVATLFFLGAGTLAAAWQRADGLVPLGLSAGLLVVAMLWEGPQTAWHGADAIPLPEETQVV
jgi:hypothetical protein